MLERRTFLKRSAALLVLGGVAVHARPAVVSALLPPARAQPSGGKDWQLKFKTSAIPTNGITLHLTEQGEGPPVLFCHGFPDTARTWHRQMEAVASAGYRALAPDMRGYGRSSAPTDPALYTPFHTVGDLVGLLDALELPSAVIVGHDWGAYTAHHAALMRPDRFQAVFCMSVAYTPRGDASLFDQMRAAGQEDTFYMFQQARLEADAQWADAASTIPGALYWASALPSAETRWSPFDPARALNRQAPVGVPAFADPEYVAFNIAEFERTGFHGGLNYYRALQPFFDLSAAYKGATIQQPSFFVMGRSDGLNEFGRPTADGLRVGLPGLVDFVDLDGVGHWPQHEAPDAVNGALLGFLGTVAAR